MKPISSKFGLCLAVLFILPFTSAQLTADVVASREECVAPCAVFFDAIGDLSWDEIEQSEFIWDFGDGRIVKGYMAAHVYELPDTAPATNYDVTLTIKQNGQLVDTDTITINVQPFTGRTICVSNPSDPNYDSGFTECDSLYSGAEHYDDFTTAWDSISYRVGGTRMLLHRGEDYSLGQPYFSSANGPVEMGDYGDPMLPMPHIVRTSDVTLFIINHDDWRFVDIEISGASPNQEQKIYGRPTSRRNFLMMRNYIHDVVYVFAPGRQSENNFIINNTVYTSGGTFPFYLIGPNNAMVNNFIEYRDGTRCTVRIEGAMKVLINGNQFLAPVSTDTRWGRCAFTPRAGQTDPKMLDYLLFSENIITTIQNTRTGDGASNEMMRYALFEKNLFLPSQSPFLTGLPGIVMMQNADFSVHNVTIRNNIFYNFGGAVKTWEPSINSDISVYGNTMYVMDGWPAAWDTSFYYGGGTNVKIKNNILHSGATNSLSDFIDFSADPRELDASNNIAFYPNLQSACLDANGNTGAGACTDPKFVSVDPTNLDFMKLQSTSPAIDNGTALPSVFEDFDGISRPQGSGWDIGAYEYPSEAGECSVNSDCYDANACTGDKCESGTCGYINYNLDGSDTIGLGDIIQIIGYWGGSNPAVDLNGDGNVGLSDIVVLLGVWGAYC